MHLLHLPLLLLPLAAVAQQMAPDSFIIISLGEDFEGARRFSPAPQARWVGAEDALSGELNEAQLADAVRGKRVLLAIHGMSVSFSRAKNCYRMVMEGVDNGEDPPYDLIVGVRWPGSQWRRSKLSNGFVYFEASANAKKSGKQLAALLANLAAEAGSLDLFTHSMGSKVAMTALGKQSERIDNLYLTAPSIGAKTLGEKRRYGFARERVEGKIVVFFSREDPVFSAFGRKRMGYRGCAAPAEGSVLNVDCTEEIRSHSEFWRSEAVWGVVRGEGL
jgi:pimeloyl-ACP methyl ester carboxylesterase